MSGPRRAPGSYENSPSKVRTVKESARSPGSGHSVRILWGDRNMSALASNSEESSSPISFGFARTELPGPATRNHIQSVHHHTTMFRGTGPLRDSSGLGSVHVRTKTNCSNRAKVLTAYGGLERTKSANCLHFTRGQVIHIRTIVCIHWGSFRGFVTHDSYLHRNAKHFIPHSDWL